MLGRDQPRDPHEHHADPGEQPGEGVDGQRPAGAGRDHDEARQRRSEHRQAATPEGEQGVGLLEVATVDDLRHQALDGRHGERRHHPVEGLQDCLLYTSRCV